MATPIIMPRFGQSVEVCILTEWQKEIGDEVKKGDILFTYETDKASFEEESEVEGLLLAKFFEDGDEVPVLTNVAVVGNEGEDVESFRPGGSEEKPAEDNSQATDQQQTQKIQDEPKEPVINTTSDNQEVRISPRAKKLAEKLLVPYKNLTGSGPEGRVIEKDIENAAQAGMRTTSLAQQVAKETGLGAPTEGTSIAGRVGKSDLTEKTISSNDYEVQKLSNMRRIVSQKMFESLQNSAQLTHHISADARMLKILRKQCKTEAVAGKLPNITINDMVSYAVVQTLKEHPYMNAHFVSNEIRLYNSIHLGMAVNTERGLMVPVLKNAQQYNMPGLSENLKNLADQCHKGNIDPDLLASEQASFTISNLGVYGIEMFTPVLNIPQVGILGVNTITYRPSDLGDGNIGFVPRIGLSLTYDHRAVDGAPASAFLKELVNQIENIKM